jgi:hypothetical protein
MEEKCTTGVIGWLKPLYPTSCDKKSPPKRAALYLDVERD